MEFEKARFMVQKGDTLTSKKGFLTKSPITKKYYLVKKVTYLGKDYIAIEDDNKQEIDVKKIS